MIRLSTCLLKVGSPGGGKAPPDSVKLLLIRTKLMTATKPSRITKNGYEFMLKDIHLQMWIFLLEYIKQKAQTTGDTARDEILQFLFQLSFCHEADSYPGDGFVQLLRFPSIWNLLMFCLRLQ